QRLSVQVGACTHCILQVNVAEWCATKTVEGVANSNLRSVNTHVQGIRLQGVSARGSVQDSDGTSNVLGLARVQSLPDPVETVNHGVMQEEDGVVGGG